MNLIYCRNMACNYLSQNAPHYLPTMKKLRHLATMFGVSTESMQLSYDTRGNSVPTILLQMQRHLYAQGGLQAEGIFRINTDNTHTEASLLDWAINLMVDVVQEEHLSRMNAHNIAMVLVNSVSPGIVGRKMHTYTVLVLFIFVIRLQIIVKILLM